MLRSERRNAGTLTIGGLAIPLAAWDFARAAIGHRRSTVCVSRRRDAKGNWREVRRYNAWRPGDDLDVVPPMQDALSPILPAPAPRILIAGRC